MMKKEHLLNLSMVHTVTIVKRKITNSFKFYDEDLNYLNWYFIIPIPHKRKAPFWRRQDGFYIEKEFYYSKEEVLDYNQYYDIPTFQFISDKDNTVYIRPHIRFSFESDYEILYFDTDEEMMEFANNKIINVLGNKLITIV
jgi:hypothetical protein